MSSIENKNYEYAYAFPHINTVNDNDKDAEAILLGNYAKISDKEESERIVVYRMNGTYVEYLPSEGYFRLQNDEFTRFYVLDYLDETSEDGIVFDAGRMAQEIREYASVEVTSIPSIENIKENLTQRIIDFLSEKKFVTLDSWDMDLFPDEVSEIIEQIGETVTNLQVYESKENNEDYYTALISTDEITEEQKSDIEALVNVKNDIPKETDENILQMLDNNVAELELKVNWFNPSILF